MTKTEIEKLAFELSRRILSRDDVPELISIDRWAKNLIKTALTEVHDGAMGDADWAAHCAIVHAGFKHKLTCPADSSEVVSEAIQALKIAAIKEEK